MSVRERTERALAAHGAFERDGETYRVTTTVFEATAVVREEADAPDGTSPPATALVVTVRVPTIDAVVAGETVAPVVQEGWLETFERRLEDVGGVTRTTPRTHAVTLDDAAGEVVVEATLEVDRPDVAAADAKAVVDYVEGTFVEGIIPGYTYLEPAAGLIERARTAGER